MHRTMSVFSTAVAVAAVTACSAPLSQVGQNPAVPGRLSPPNAPSAPAARTELRDSTGQLVGSGIFEQTPNGVLVTVQFSSLAPGTHALHIHSVGVCEPPFTSAGGHFNPGGKNHGFRNSTGPHAGDAPNFYVSQGGSARADVLFSGVTLSPGANSLFDADGASLVVHAGADDYTTDPAGSSGARVACGVIRTQ